MLLEGVASLAGQHQIGEVVRSVAERGNLLAALPAHRTELLIENVRLERDQMIDLIRSSGTVAMASQLTAITFRTTKQFPDTTSDGTKLATFEHRAARVKQVPPVIKPTDFL